MRYLPPLIISGLVTLNGCTNVNMELAKQKLDEEKKKLVKQLKEKAGDALKKLFKKP